MRKFFIFLFFFSFAFSCCCYPHKSCLLVIKSTKTASEMAKQILASQDTKFYAHELERINNLLKQINDIETMIVKTRQRINAIKIAQGVYLNNINKLLNDINNLKFLYLKILSEYNNVLTLKNKIYLFNLNYELAKINYKNLKEMLK